MKVEKKIAKGKMAVIKKNGSVVFASKAYSKGLRIEGDSSFFEITEKAEKDLTTEEKERAKIKGNQLKSGKAK